MKFKNKEKYPLELWSSYKTVLFQRQAVLNKWGLCWQNCTFWIAGLLWGGRAGRQPGSRWLVPLWHVPEEPSLLAAQHLTFWSFGVSWRALAVSGHAGQLLQRILMSYPLTSNKPRNMHAARIPGRILFSGIFMYSGSCNLSLGK